MNKKIVIIDYGSGNLHSAQKAFRHVATDKDLVFLSSNPKDLEDATHIVLPGVGAFADCMAGLSAIDGMIDILEKRVLKDYVPFLGICVGMQLLATKGFENGEHKGLGWIEGEVVPIETAGNIKIPHMGWNNIIRTKTTPLLVGTNEQDVYFVHSFHMETDEENIIATCKYGEVITAAVAKDNIMGVQFHPEKSQTIGLQILQNFVNINF